MTRFPVRLCALVFLAALAAGCSAPGGSEATTAKAEAAKRHSASPAPTADAASARTGWGPTLGELRRARAAVERLTLAEKAGQVIVARYGGTAPPTRLVERYHLGGLIVMEENVASVEAVRRSNAVLQHSDDRGWPLFLGVDQEGGIVERLPSPVTSFPALMTYGASGRSDLVHVASRASGAELRAAGFTAVFAPDADVTMGPEDPTIGSRSVGSRPDQVGRMATAAMRGYRDAGILPVVKHFPGHGSVGTDSHLGLPVQHASVRQLWRRDLKPFRTAIAAHAPATMMAHLDVRALDSGTPATLSREVVTGVLRGRMGFDGLVVTDAMEMAAIVDRIGTGPAAVRSLLAGADTVLMPADLPAAHHAIVQAVRSGRLPESRLDQAATRMVALMLHQDATGSPPPGPAVIGSHQHISHQASRAAITVVDGPCSGRLVGDSVHVSGDSAAASAFRSAAEAAGLTTGGGTSVKLLGYGDSAASGDVVVATDTPYPLGRSDARTAIATYGDTPGAMRALVDVLLGQAPAPGRLPVPVDGVTRPGC